MTSHRARKRFGQHFLHDPGIIRKIVETLNPLPHQQLVEIGPGLGAITTQVLPRAEHLTALELDRDVIPLLQERVAHLGQLTLIQTDALRFDFASLSGPLRVFGNLPYNISTPLLFHLLDYATLIDDMLFMLQKEVVDRLVAQPNTAEYGRLSVMIQYAVAVKKCFNVPPGAFNPPPRVYSAIVHLTPYKELPYPAINFQRFSDIVRLAFNQRRKTLRNSLKTLFTAEDWQQLADENSAIAPEARPESLSVADFVTLANIKSCQ